MSSFGQGISVTQTQMLRAFTAIANDGVMLEPKFISALYDPNDQSVRKSQKEIVGNPVSKAAASSTRDHMVMVEQILSMVSCTTIAQESLMSMFQVRMSPSNQGLLRLPMRRMGLPDRWNQLYLLCCIHASCRKSWLYPLCNGATARALFRCSAWEFANPILERASAMKESLNLQSTAKSLIRSARRQVMPCQLPRTFTPVT